MKNTLLFFLAIALVACGSKTTGLDESASQAVEQITCQNSESALFDVMYESLTKLKQEPTTSELQSVFAKAIDQKENLKKHEQEILALTKEFYLILEKIPSANLYEKLQKITAAEIGLQTNAEEISTQKQISNFQAKWKLLSSRLDASCPEDENNPPSKFPPENGETVTAVMNPVIFGARKVLATAYQSCTADEKKPMTSNTEDVKGIKIVGTHSDGVGSKRVIEDIDALLATDYYYNGTTQGTSCKDPRKFPLIYDYGGRPNTDSGTFNLFLNASEELGDMPVLGIDCSGYVFTALAVAGLRVAPGKNMKAVGVHGINSRAFLSPDSNGLSCLAKVKMGVTGTLKQGDIAAVGGHVLMIDSVGADPLGILDARTTQECEAITPADFDFVVVQSSSTKNGIGLNKFEARGYLPLQDSEKMRLGFVKYAKDACKARLSGKDVQMTASNFQITRHKMTADCKTSTRIALTAESCIAQCPSLAQR